MYRILLSISVCLAALVAMADSFYNSTEFYAILSIKGTESSLVNAVFADETDGSSKEKSASLDSLGYEFGKNYSESEKINLVHRARALRYAYRQDIARARKEIGKSQKGDGKIKFNLEKKRFVPIRFEEWIQTSEGTNALEFVMTVSMDFNGFLSYLVTGMDALNPRDVLRRKIGNLEKKTKDEQIDWLYRAYVCRAAIEEMKSPFYSSAEFYAILSANGTESSLVDAVFTYETDGSSKEKSESLACLGYESDKNYSESEKINLVHRSRALRHAYRKDVARAIKEHRKPPKGKDNIKFHLAENKFIPPSFEEWIQTSLGTNALESAKSVTMDFDGFLSYLIKGRGALHPSAVLHLEIGNIEKKNKSEQIDWLYRVHLCLIRVNAEKAKRSRPRNTKPRAKQEAWKPPIKLFRVRE